MIEVELKAHVADPAKVEAALRSFTTFVRAFDKKDAYWHGPEWRAHRGTRGFRVRTDDGEATATFKDKRTEGGIEINREREFVVSDPGAFAEFVERLGCEPFYAKRKRGLRFETGQGKSRAIALELAELDGLGWFLEIEELVPEGDPAAIALAQGEIRSLLARAGVDESEIEPRFYSELLMDAGLVSRA